MRYGENALAIINRIKEKLKELKKSLPPDVQIKTAYDRSTLIDKAIDNLKDKLVEESIVVALIIIFFLLHLHCRLLYWLHF